VSPLEGSEMIGGDFSANTQGLEHYKKHGYKGPAHVSMWFYCFFCYGCIRVC
jgi:hypothetical protein